jgi:hypothetical protein
MRIENGEIKLGIFSNVFHVTFNLVIKFCNNLHDMSIDI